MNKKLKEIQTERHLWCHTYGNDVGLHGQEVEEGEELDCEDGVDLCGGQHQHAKGQQHLGITRWNAAASPPRHTHTGQQRVPGVTHLREMGRWKTLHHYKHGWNTMEFPGDYSDDYNVGNGNSLINGCVWGTYLCGRGPMVIVLRGKRSARLPYIYL